MDIVQQDSIVKHEIGVLEASPHREEIIRSFLGHTGIDTIAHGRSGGWRLPLKYVDDCLYGRGLVRLVFEFELHAIPFKKVLGP